MATPFLSSPVLIMWSWAPGVRPPGTRRRDRGWVGIEPTFYPTAAARLGSTSAAGAANGPHGGHARPAVLEFVRCLAAAAVGAHVAAAHRDRSDLGADTLAFGAGGRDVDALREGHAEAHRRDRQRDRWLDWNGRRRGPTPGPGPAVATGLPATVDEDDRHLRLAVLDRADRRGALHDDLGHAPRSLPSDVERPLAGQIGHC